MAEDAIRVLREHMANAWIAYDAAFPTADGFSQTSLEAKALRDALERLGLMVRGLEHLARERVVMQRRQAFRVV
ncbi:MULTISPECIES: hypothetical protein [unclassified Aureimonas]|uniref:hypothetical protein n=1 Tax=unclassified Aureimonas TaxID=2615206 RepID=UPI000700FC0E|nr:MULTISPECIES: hypothetical protein [unclassified Aureimonas]KQT55194.1 hypothetical protein ASG62_10160 [Aureimonas sp. Leaf427]KQT70984.1 hypothetical protein ASG54_20545 [Aureimonas sp. Leaf460]